MSFTFDPHDHEDYIDLDDCGDLDDDFCDECNALRDEVGHDHAYCAECEAYLAKFEGVLA